MDSNHRPDCSDTPIKPNPMPVVNPFLKNLLTGYSHRAIHSSSERCHINFVRERPNGTKRRISFTSHGRIHFTIRSKTGLTQSGHPRPQALNSRSALPKFKESPRRFTHSTLPATQEETRRITRRMSMAGGNFLFARPPATTYAFTHPEIFLTSHYPKTSSHHPFDNPKNRFYSDKMYQMRCRARPTHPLLVFEVSVQHRDCHVTGFLHPTGLPRGWIGIESALSSVQPSL